VKRKDLVRHLRGHDCSPLREGRKHTVFINGLRNKISTVPRHGEINDFLVRKICLDLEFPAPF